MRIAARFVTASAIAIAIVLGTVGAALAVPPTTATVTFLPGYSGTTGCATPQTEAIAAVVALKSNTCSWGLTRTFAGWNSTQAGARNKVVEFTDGANYTFTSSVALYAVFTGTQTISFSGGPGVVCTIAPVVASGNSRLPNACSRAGYRFDNWRSTANSSNYFSDAQTINVFVNGDDTLTAQWSLIPDYYTVSYLNYNGAAYASPRIYNVNELISHPADPSRSGYTFDGWYDGETKVLAGDPAANHVLTAFYNANQHNVYFNEEGGTAVLDQLNVDYGTFVRLPSISWTGHTFNGWYDGETLMGQPNQSIVMGDADITLTADWTIDTYDVTYDEALGNAVSDDTDVDYNSSITLPTPTRTGYSFDGWYDGETLVGAGGASFTIPANDTALTAHWVAAYEVTFVENGGAAVSDLHLQRPGSTVTLPTPSWSGKTFVGWYDAATAGKVVADGFTMPANDVTLYAYWVANISGTVFFNANGSDASCTTASQTETADATPLTNAGCTWNDRTFEGWAESPTATAIDYAANANYDFVTAGSSTGGLSMLYAVWSGTVTFTANLGAGGSCASPQTAIGNGVALTANSCTRSNYTFKYWTTTSYDTGTKYADGTPYNFAQSGSRTLYAQWTAVTAGGQGPAIRSEVGISSSAPRVGRRVTSSTGRWYGIGRITYSYAWLRCSVAQGAASASKPGACDYISGANSRSYRPVTADQNSYLVVEITATDLRGSTARYTKSTSYVR